jgi:Uma2 family endonuclease
MSVTIAAPKLSDQRRKAIVEDGPQVKRWTIEEFYNLNGQSLFGERHTELIDGEIFVMPEQLFIHLRVMMFLSKYVEACFGETAWVRYQAPVLIPSRNTYVEPDVSAIAGSLVDCQEHPTTALFVAEVSQTSIYHDKVRKVPVYACMQVPEYWIVNVPKQFIMFYTKPVKDKTSVTGFTYAKHQEYKLTDTIALQAFPKTPILVSELFR